MARNGFHVGSTSDIAMAAVLIAIVSLPIGIIGWVMPIQKPSALPTHVHTPNTLVLAFQTIPPDPFTTTSITPVLIPGMVVGPVKQQNATHAFWTLILAQVTVKISAGIGNIQVDFDGVASGAGASFSNTNYQTVSLFLMQNNTFTDNLTHTISISVSSDNAAHTVSVCALDSDCFASGLGNVVTLLSVADLSSAPPI